MWSRRSESLIAGQVQKLQCVSHISESGQVGIEGFTDFLIPLIEFETFIRHVYINCEIFFELGDYCVDFIGIFIRGVLKCTVNFQSTLTDRTEKESFLVLNILTGNFRDHRVVKPGLFPQLPFFRQRVCKVEWRWWFYLWQWQSIHLSLVRSRHRRLVRNGRRGSS